MPHHLLTLWNPSYAEDALDQHLQVFLHWAERYRRGEVAKEEVFVWWAKLRSTNRTGALPHLGDILALENQIDEGVETHLYLTDYRSLYVAHLGQVSDEEGLLEDAGERDHAPAYYQGLHADAWFQLWDLRRLVRDDTPAVIAELRSLLNTRYFDRPVSLYGGIVDLPLIVKRQVEVAWFQGVEELTEGQFWAEREAHLRGEADRMSRELRDNLFGHDVWSLLEPATRDFLASAEAVYRARRGDPGFDCTGPAISYAKAVEVELNALIFPALRGALAGRPAMERETRSDGRLLDLGGIVPHQTLGSIQTLLKHDTVLKGTLPGVLPQDHRWLTGELIYRLPGLLDLRNAAAHAEPVRAEELEPARREVIGVGEEGLIVRVARAKARGV